jgi:hypothetical protein
MITQSAKCNYLGDESRGRHNIYREIVAADVAEDVCETTSTSKPGSQGWSDRLIGGCHKYQRVCPRRGSDDPQRRVKTLTACRIDIPGGTQAIIVESIKCRCGAGTLKQRDCWIKPTGRYHGTVRVCSATIAPSLD